MRSPRYLLKFVSEESHANDLLNGIMFMRPACYYHGLEFGQGDLKEGAISHDMCVYKNSHLPIFCTYSVYDSDIADNIIKASKCCIDDFGCKDGYVVILDFPGFEQALKTLPPERGTVDGGPVIYHEMTFDDTFALIGDKSVSNLFVKDPALSYQQEYRIVIEKEVYKMGEKPLDHIIAEFPKDLRNIAVSEKISNLETDDKYLYIPAEKLCNLRKEL